MCFAQDVFRLIRQASLVALTHHLQCPHQIQTMPILTAAHEKASATAVASSAAGGEEVEDYAPLIYQDSQRTGEGRRPQQQLLQPSRRIRTLLILHVELLLEQTSLPQLLLVMLHLH